MLLNSKRVISNFKDKYFTLSLDYPSPLTMDGLVFPTATHMYEAAKTTNKKDWEILLSDSNPEFAKEIGSIMKIRPDWSDLHIPFLIQIVELKYIQHKELYWYLWETRYYTLDDKSEPEGLGIILMNIRDRTSAGYKEIKHERTSNNSSG